MNIVLLAFMYAPYPGGGAERVVRTQAEGLAARGHCVTVLTLGEPGTGVTSTDVNGVDVVRVGIANFYYPGSSQPPPLARVAWHARDVWNPAMARAARKQLSALRPDIVLCHNIVGWSAAVWDAIHSLGLPIVQVLHDQYLRCIRSTLFTSHRCTTRCLSCQAMRLPHRRWSRLPDAVVGVSRFVLESHLQDGYFADVPHRTFIYNAVHLDTRHRTCAPRTGAELVLGFIGGLVPLKGIEPLLQAFRKVGRPHWRLRVAGTGEPAYVERLRRTYEDPRISFLGRQDPAEFYLDLDATVVPSLCDEALGMVVLESLVHGRPVIGSARGGIPELIEEGIDGTLFDPGDSGALERALTKFAGEMESWRSRQPAIHAAAARRWGDLDAWIERWETLLSKVVAAGAGARP